jgi:hypothetical protein
MFSPPSTNVITDVPSQSDLFENMSLEDWHKVLAPKVQGTINLHEALLHSPLDFFVMTSSTLGIAGASTQSNYAAANTFLDSMARHRWSLGLEACSIALGMVVGVGHMETHPEVKEIFQHRNVYGIPEDEFLKMMEMACRPRGSVVALSEHDAPSVAHIITGMEPSKLADSGIQPSWLNDPRFSGIRAAIDKLATTRTADASDKHATSTNFIRSSHEKPSCHQARHSTPHPEPLLETSHGECRETDLVTESSIGRFRHGQHDCR